MNILGRLQRTFSVEPAVSVEWLIDAGQLEAVNTFFAENGAPVLMVTYADQNFNIQKSKEAFRIQKKNLRGTKRFFFHNAQLPLKEDTVVFVRVFFTHAITDKNILAETFSFRLDPAKGFVPPLYDYLNTYILPGMLTQKGNMNKLTPKEHADFCDFVQDYLRSMETVIACSEEHVMLPPYLLGDQVHYTDMEGLAALAKTPEGLSLLEENACAWMKKIAEEVKAVELIRVEREQTGPHGEFKFWKCQMTRMNSLVEELARPDIINVLAILSMVQSNVTPKTMISRMPNLMKALSLIYQCSTFYNTYSHMTVLLVKITNQIIETCKRYLTNNHTKSIWDQDSSEIIKRMTECIEINLAYQNAYRETRKGMLESNAKRVFNFSEVQIFGNMNLFTQRLDYLTRVLKTLEQYSVLRTFVLEGKEALISRLDRINALIVSKKYDYLDHRNPLFEADYEDFKDKIAEVHAVLTGIINVYFNKPKGLLNAIHLQQRLETLAIPGLEHAERYRQICMRLMNEINEISEKVQEHIENPPLERNMPHFAGRIAWARNYYRRLEEPMNVICQMAAKILLSPEGQELVSCYNDVAGQLVAYEITVYQTWTKLILKKMNGLSASLLTFSELPPPFGRPYANLDPEIIGLLREIACLDKLQCPIPPLAVELWAQTDNIRHNYENLKSVLDEIDRFKDLMRQIKDIRNNRIDKVITDLGLTKMLDLPGPNDPCPEIMDLVRLTKQQTSVATEVMNNLTTSALKATVEMLNLLLHDYDQFVDENNLTAHIEMEVQLRLAHMDNQEGGGARPPPKGDAVMTPPVVSPDTTAGSPEEAEDGSMRHNELTPEMQASVKTAVQIALAANEVMSGLGQQATDAVCLAVRKALDSIWLLLSCRDAAGVLKDIPPGKKVKCG
ncbi:Dynein heavy chain 5, axonemal [Sparganum proliferum]